MSEINISRYFLSGKRLLNSILQIAQPRQGLQLNFDRGLPSSNQRVFQLKSKTATLKPSVDVFAKITDPARHQAMENVSRLLARMRAFQTMPLYADTARQKEPQVFQDLLKAVQEVEPVLLGQAFDIASLNKEVKQADIALEDLFQRSEFRLRQLERDAVIITAGQVLDDLGYQITEKKAGVQAIKGRKCIWAKDDGQGQLILEPSSGFPNMTCMEEFARVKDGLLQKGIVLEPVACGQHRPDQNGVLEMSQSGSQNLVVLPYANLQGDYGFDVQPLNQVQRIKEVC